MKLVMPKIGMNMTDGQIVKWHCEDGAKITAGDPMVDIETDKLTETINAPATGIFHKGIEAGEYVECGEQIGEIEEG